MVGGGPGDSPIPATYLVVISRPSAGEKYKFDFVRKVEGILPTDKEDSFIFSVSPHDTASLTDTGGAQGNDAFYQRGKVTIKSESMTDIDSALSVSGNLEVGGGLQIGRTSNNLTVSNTGVLSNLKVGTDNYELVYLNGVDLECVNSSGELR